MALARVAIRRPTERALGVALAAAGGWYGWSPGTAFGLPGAYGGWLFAAGHLLDTGLVGLAVAAALVGSSTRAGGVDEQLRARGSRPGRVVGAVAGGGAMVAVAGATAFALGAGAGGAIRAALAGGPWWAEGRAGGGVGADLLVDLRLAVAVALVGALAALVGWWTRRDELAAGAVVVLTVGYLDVFAAAFGRARPLVSALALTPFGALRAVATADRGLAAPGSSQAAPVAIYALVLAGWCCVALRLAVPRRTPLTPRLDPSGIERRRPATRASGARVTRVGIVGLAVAVTFAAGAVLPARVASSRPWRWQSAWREAHRRGSASDQVVDTYLADRRAGRATQAAALLAPGAAVGPAVLDAVGRASRVERQPTASMADPGLVAVALSFDHPVPSGGQLISRYGVRFDLVRTDPHTWRIQGAEGPVALSSRPAG